MQTRLSTSLLSFLLLTTYVLILSCTSQPQYPDELLAIDRLTMNRPDSALLLLRGMKPRMTHESESVRRYYQLLMVKAQDKAYIRHTSDSLVIDLLHYYTEKGDLRLLPQACYYAGRVTRDLGDALQALDYFHQALYAMSQPSYQRAMKGHEQEMLQLQGKVFAQMGYLFSRQHLYDEAIKAFKHGYSMDSINQDTLGMIKNLRDLGNVFQLSGIYLDALSSYGDAEQYALLKKDTTLLFKVSVQKAFLYNRLGEYSKAKEALLKYPLFLSNSNKSSVYSIAAEIYSNLKDKDNARDYFIKLLNSNDIVARSNANLWLGQQASINGNEKKALYYIREYMLLQDSINLLKNDESVALSQSLYNYQLREHEISELKVKETSLKARLWMYIALAAIVSILLAIAFTLLYIEHMHRRKINLQYEHLQRIIAANKQHAELKQELTKASVSDLKNNKTYKKVWQKCNSQQPLNQNDWKEIETLFDTVMPEFLPKLRSIQSYNGVEALFAGKDGLLLA